MVKNARKICPECGRVSKGDDAFCPGCGARLVIWAHSQDAPEEDMSGRVIDRRFQILERIGRGGMSTVYRAEQTSIARPVALKVLSPQLSSIENVKKRFHNEAALASRLNHPNTVTIYDFGESSEGLLYIAMELVEGQNLGKEIKANGAMSWQRACRIAVQLAESLQNAHDMGIIHRDLKPENIMLTVCGEAPDMVKVLDFGIAKIVSGRGGAETAGLTSPNQVFGTPSFMSPEQVAGKELDHRTDIYSLGILIYLMLTARLPFGADTPRKMMLAQLKDPPSKFDQVRPDVSFPVRLKTLVMSMLAKDRNGRPGTMRTVVTRLCEVLEVAPLGFATWTPPSGVAVKTDPFPQSTAPTAVWEREEE